jgi:hypothetical protein
MTCLAQEWSCQQMIGTRTSVRTNLKLAWHPERHHPRIGGSRLTDRQHLLAADRINPRHVDDIDSLEPLDKIARVADRPSVWMSTAGMGDAPIDVRTQ